MKPKHRRSDIVVQDYEGETLVYDLLTHRALHLNSTVSLVWKSCDGKRDVEEIATVLSRNTGSAITPELVRLSLDQLSHEGLLVEVPEDGFLSGESRREVLKRVGLATMVALPLIASITVPMAVQAQSACTPVRQGCLCDQPSGGRQGQTCTATASPCASNACRCVWAANGGTNGDCVV